MREGKSKSLPKWSRTVMTAAVWSLVASPAVVMAEEAGVGATMHAAAQQAQADSKDSKTVKAPLAKITQEQAVELVKSLFPEQLKDATVNQVELGDRGSFPPQHQNVWTIHWQIRKGNNSYGFSSRVDSITGDLLQHHSYMPNSEGEEAYYPPKYTREAAREVAMDFLKKASPSVDVKSLSPNEGYWHFASSRLFGPIRYEFAYTVDVNGVHSPTNFLHISVDGSGSVINFSRNTHNQEFPSATPAISLKQAEEIFDKSADLTLQYIPSRKAYSRDKTWKLVWAPLNMEGASQDAQTGELLDYSGRKANLEQKSLQDVEKTEKRFTPATGSNNGQLTAEEAAKLAQEELPIPSDKALAGQYLRSDYNDPDKKVWQLTWSDSTPSPNSYTIMAAVDAKTGQILEYRPNDFGPPWLQSEKKEEIKNPITKDEARKQAIGLINRLYPAASEELKLVPVDPYPGQEGKSYPFVFKRLYKGTPIGSDNINLTLDASGKLTSYYGTRSEDLEEKLKGLEAKVTREEALAKFKEALKVQLQYRSFGGYYMDGGLPQPEVIKLVYSRAPSNPQLSGEVLDAITGEWTSFYEMPNASAQKGGQLPKELEDHWAAAELKVLFEFGVLRPDDNGALEPDAAIKLGDWMNLMNRAANPSPDSMPYFGDENKPVEFSDVPKDSPYYAASQFFIQAKWLDPSVTGALNPEKSLTREELAVQLLHIVHYDKLAALMGDNSVQELEDREEIREDARGAVSLAIQLGLLSAGPDSRFELKREVTRAEAAVVLIRLVHLQGKLDQGIAGNY